MKNRNLQSQIEDIKEAIRELQTLVEQLEITQNDTDSTFQVGDIVRILSSGKTGKKGDLAEVTKVGSERISITLISDLVLEGRTFRKAKYLTKVKYDRNESEF